MKIEIQLTRQQMEMYLGWIGGIFESQDGICNQSDAWELFAFWWED